MQHATTFGRNRDRLLAGNIGTTLVDDVRTHMQAAGVLSDKRFTVGGTLLGPWVSPKSFRPREERRARPPDDPLNPTPNSEGERGSNPARASTKDSDAQLARKSDGDKAVLAHLAHLLLENRYGVVVA